MTNTRENRLPTKVIYQAITDLRQELALLDSTIQRVEALAEDPPRRLRPRKPNPNRPIVRRPKEGTDAEIDSLAA